MARAGKAKRRGRGRVIVLAVLGAIVGSMVAYRQQQLARHRSEFHETYG